MQGLILCVPKPSPNTAQKFHFVLEEVTRTSNVQVICFFPTDFLTNQYSSDGFVLIVTIIIL